MKRNFPRILRDLIFRKVETPSEKKPLELESKLDRGPGADSGSSGNLELSDLPAKIPENLDSARFRIWGSKLPTFVITYPPEKAIFGSSGFRSIFFAIGLINLSD